MKPLSISKCILDNEYLTTADVLLVPKQGSLKSRQDAQLDTGPLIYSAPMDKVTDSRFARCLSTYGQVGVVSRFGKTHDRIQHISDHMFLSRKNKKVPWVAVGLKELNEAKYWVDNLSQRVGIALDIAHGDMTEAHHFTNMLARRTITPKYIMSGSVCTPEAAARAWLAGCTHIRIGVGPGAACTTRVMTGCGVPQLTAVYRIAQHFAHIYPTYSERLKPPTLIADGGVKEPGDMVKYLAAGADAVMMGSAFSKCKESAGWEIRKKGWLRGSEMVKTYRGQASAAFQKDVLDTTITCPEGASSKEFVWDGLTAFNVIMKYQGGLRSALSYLGLERASSLHPGNVEFIKITPASYIEGTPHGV